MIVWIVFLFLRWIYDCIFISSLDIPLSSL